MRQGRTWLRRGALLLIAAALAMQLTHIPAMAATEYDPDSPGKLVIRLSQLETDQEGVKFAIYQVGSFDGGGWQYVLDDAFLQEGLNFDDWKTARDYQEAALAMEGLVSQWGLAPLAEGSTDETGTAVFEDLAHGIYLLVQTDTANYGIVEPFLTAIPYMEEGADWVYEVETVTKGEKFPPETETATETTAEDETTAETESTARPGTEKEPEKEGGQSGNQNAPASSGSDSSLAASSSPGENETAASVHTGDPASILLPTAVMAAAMAAIIAAIAIRRKKN